MKTPKKLETSFRRIEEIRYDNEHGGAYAYLQFMAHTRDLLVLLRPVKSAERQAEAIEAIAWLFNENMSLKFSHSHRLIFEEKQCEIKKIFNSIRDAFGQKTTPEKTTTPPPVVRRPYDGKLYHAQAA